MPVIRELEVGGEEVLGEIPQHLRKFSLRELLTIPWDYWRFPEGVNSVRASYLYDEQAASPGARANEPRLQIKEIARRSAPGSPGAGDGAAGETGRIQRASEVLSDAE
jgi:hypothetical protein